MERNTSDESNRCEARNEIKQEQENTRYNGQFKVDVFHIHVYCANRNRKRIILCT